MKTAHSTSRKTAQPHRQPGVRRFPSKTLLLIILIALLPYVNVFKNRFIGYDDQNLIQNNETIRSISIENIRQMFTPRLRGNYQPIRTLSYAIDYALWGLNPFGFQLTNVLLHALTVMGVFFLLRRLLSNNAALWSALIFAVLPIHVESVAWMSSRKDVLSLAFFLLAILLYEESSSRKSTALYAASLIAAALALLSKLTAVTIPFCILLLEICRDGWPDWSEWKKKSIRLAPYLVLVGIVVGLNFLQPQSAPVHGDALAGLEQVGPPVIRDIWLSMPLVIWRYIGLSVVPYHLSTHYEVARITDVVDGRFLIPLSLLVLMITSAVTAFIRGKRAFAFCIAWFFITFLPTSNIIPTAAMLVDRYMHTPSMGIAALLGMAAAYPWEAVTLRKRAFRSLAVIPAILLVLLLATLTIRRNADWRTTFSLFSRTLAVNPQSVDARLALGAVHEKDGEFDSAVNMYLDALKIAPNNYRVLYNLGVTYMKKGWRDHAIRALEHARSANPSFIDTRFNLALAYQQQGRRDEAIAEHEAILKIDPRFALSHGALGRIYLEMGSYDSALAELNQALHEQPDLVPALLDRAQILTRQGRNDLAEDNINKLKAQ
jgi:Flp pilus assembly protein TadD